MLPKRQSKRLLDSVKEPETQKDPEIKDPEITCGICLCEICKDDTPNTTVHKDADKWSHDFHTSCISKWVKVCQTQDIHPTCPMCPSFKIPSTVIKQITKQEGEIIPAEIIAQSRLLMLCRDLTRSTVYLCVMICVDNECIMKLTNIDLNVSTYSTLAQIKEIIRGKSMDIYSEMGLLSVKNIKYNLTPSNWTNMRYPVARITDTHYAVPPFCGRIWELDQDIDETAVISDMYIKYQTTIGEMHNDIDIDIRVKRHIRDIYNQSNLYWNRPTGPDDPGSYDCAYVNPENPQLGLHSRAYRYNTQSTEDSLMWLAIHIDYE